MTTIEKTVFRDSPTIEARIPIQTLDAENSMLCAVLPITRAATSEVAYDVQAQLYAGLTALGLREYKNISGTNISDTLVELIKGHPEGYPKGLWPMTTDVTCDTTEVRIRLIEVQPPKPVRDLMVSFNGGLKEPQGRADLKCIDRSTFGSLSDYDKHLAVRNSVVCWIEQEEQRYEGERAVTSIFYVYPEGQRFDKRTDQCVIRMTQYRNLYTSEVEFAATYVLQGDSSMHDLVFSYEKQGT